MTELVRTYTKRKTIRRKESFNALVLMPGGARGAYQVGALLLLAERGIEFDVVMGSSIGALNGAFYVQSGGSLLHIKELCNIWLSLPREITRTVGFTTIMKIANLILNEKRPIDSLSSFVNNLIGGKEALFNASPLSRIVDSIIDYTALQRSPKKLFIAVMESWGPLFDIITAPIREAVYLDSHELTCKELRRAILASAAIPIVFPPQEIRGTYCVDAGWTPISLDPILAMGNPDLIVTVELSDRSFSTSRLSEMEKRLPLLRIIPSEPIHNGIFSTFNFSTDPIKRLIQLGYRDAAKAVDRFRAKNILPPDNYLK